MPFAQFRVIVYLGYSVVGIWLVQAYRKRIVQCYAVELELFVYLRVDFGVATIVVTLPVLTLLVVGPTHTASKARDASRE